MNTPGLKKASRIKTQLILDIISQKMLRQQQNLVSYGYTRFYLLYAMYVRCARLISLKHASLNLSLTYTAYIAAATRFPASTVPMAFSPSAAIS